MSDLHEMLLVLMNYERTETVKARRDVVRNIMEALVEREKLLTEAKVIEYIGEYIAEDSSRAVTLDRSNSGLNYVTLSDPKHDSNRHFSSVDSLMDAFAQCVHTLKNEKPRT
jgi:hypothetical protein